MRTEAPRGRRYGAAFLTATVASLAALALAPFEGSAPFPLFLAAVAIATWYGGLGPGLLATALGALAANYFLRAPAFTVATVLDNAVFILVAVLISSLHARQFRARRRAEAAVRSRDEILAVVSHDLKNPVAVVQGQTERLQRQLARGAAPPTERLSSALAQIGGAAARMLRLIDELLDIAHIQVGEPIILAPRDIDLVALVRRVVVEFDEADDSHHIVCHAAVPALVGRWDPDRIERVLANLLSNAVKYTPPVRGAEATVRVEVGVEPQAAARSSRGDTIQWATIRVTDRGIGIPAADLPQIFRRFQRASNVGAIPGTGIGLATVRQIVELHGGAVDVASREGAGTTVTVCLPIAEGAPEDAPATLPGSAFTGTFTSST